ncbi:hypothetical protein AEM51_08940 [Bacteroidetes bacterium UKL13-3]|jgi:hypothetical protein|nr:hypothetical protein AEM51_08940 [Bacteroidetes bacterium UKL13-3]HCP94315.1 hypothetical protein [Bacteroidota bacterium]
MIHSKRKASVVVTIIKNIAKTPNITFQFLVTLMPTNLCGLKNLAIMSSDDTINYSRNYAYQLQC